MQERSSRKIRSQLSARKISFVVEVQKHHGSTTARSSKDELYTGLSLELGFPPLLIVAKVLEPSALSSGRRLVGSWCNRWSTIQAIFRLRVSSQGECLVQWSAISAQNPPDARVHGPKACDGSHRRRSRTVSRQISNRTPQLLHGMLKSRVLCEALFALPPGVNLQRVCCLEVLRYMPMPKYVRYKAVQQHVIGVQDRQQRRQCLGDTLRFPFLIPNLIGAGSALLVLLVVVLYLPETKNLEQVPVQGGSAG